MCKLKNLTQKLGKTHPKVLKRKVEINRHESQFKKKMVFTTMFTSEFHNCISKMNFTAALSP